MFEFTNGFQLATEIFPMNGIGTVDETVIYIIEDDECMLRLLSKILADSCTHLESFASLSEFLAAFDPDRVGCLVINLHLQETSGLALLKVLRIRHCARSFVLFGTRVRVSEAVEAMHMGAVERIRDADRSRTACF